MRLNSKFRMLAIAATLALVPLASPVAANAATVHPLYTGGAAVANKPYYNSSLQMYQFTCTFAGWVQGVTKNWTCKLQYGGSNLQVHGGSFTDSYYNTALYSQVKSNGVSVCAVAIASYADGTGYESNTQCS